MIILTLDARTRRKISLRQLAVETGIPKSTLNDIERNLTSPTFDQIEKIAMALDVKIMELFYSDYK